VLELKIVAKKSDHKMDNTYLKSQMRRMEKILIKSVIPNFGGFLICSYSTYQKLVSTMFFWCNTNSTGLHIILCPLHTVCTTNYCQYTS